MALRVPQSRQPGLQVDSKEGCAAEHASSRTGLFPTHRRHRHLLIAAPKRRGRRCRVYAKHIENVTHAVKACVPCGGSGGVGGQAEAIDASSAPLQQVCRLLRLEGAEELQDLIASLILSECVYKKLELDEESVAAKVTEFVSSFPSGWVQLQAVQLSLPGIPQHYLIATSPTSMYVAFMGTKQFQDILADANLLHTPIWAESARLAADQQSIPAAHRGFLERARAIHVEQLYELAVSRGLRLVLCGHSLGGAVAKLCTLRLLRELPDWPRPRVRCIAFATPAVGNAALAELVESAGWASHFSTYYLPEDQLVRLISFSQARTTTSSSSTGSGGGGGGTVGGNGGNGSVERRRRRAKERAAQRVAVRRPAPAPAGGEGATVASPASRKSAAAARADAASTAGPAAGARLDEATLGRLGAEGAAAPASPAAAAAAAPQEPLSAAASRYMPRVASTSSIASASSCASAVTSSTTPGGGSSSGASSTSSSRSLRREGTFGHDAPTVDGVGATLRERRAAQSPSLSRSTSSVSRASSSVGDSDWSLDIPKPAQQHVSPPAPVAAAAAEMHCAPGVAAGPSFVESLDEAGVALAMEEILAPGPDALEAAAAAGVALGGQPPADLAAAQREALYGNAGGSWGLRLALGRKRVMRRLRRLAARARIPLPKALLPVSRYHTFGEQWFVTEQGALSPEELEAALRQQKTQDQQQPPPQPQPQQAPPPPQQQQQQAGTATAGAAGSAAAPQDGARGFFSFHRMVAYRQRHADLVARLVRSAGGLESGDSPAGELAVHPPPQATGIASTSTAAAGAAAGVAAPHYSVQLSDSLLPRISVQRAVLRGLLPEPPRSDRRPAGAAAGGGGGDDAAAGETAAGAAAATGHHVAGGAPVIGHLWSWVRGGGAGAGAGRLYRSGGDGGGRSGSPDEPVQLDMELEGHNLQYCRKVSVALVRDGADVAAAASAAAGVAAAAAAAAAPAAAATAAASTAAGFPAAVAPVTATAARATPGASTGSGRATRWAPFGMARGGSSTAEAAAASATPQQQSPPGPAAAAAGTAAATRASFPPPSSASVSSPSPSVTGTAGASGTPGPATLTEVPCEVVQVLYAQPYSDEANPPPLHPVSLFRNTLHHLAGNLMRRCRLQGQVMGPGGGVASLAAAGAASASASVATLAGATGGCGALAEGYAGYCGPWRRFRFPRNPRPIHAAASSTTSGSIAVGTGGASAANQGKGVGAWQRLPGSLLAGAAVNSSAASAAAGGGGASDAVAANVDASAVVQMPSRLLLRVTLQRSVARGLLDGTLPGRLVVSARSDFHALSAVPVVVQRPRVAILGTSPYAASLVQAALSAPAALAAAGFEDRPGAAAGGAAAGAAAGVAAWVPPPVAWALAAVRGATTAATSRRVAAAAAGNANAAQAPGSTASSRLTSPGASSLPRPEVQRAPAAVRPPVTTTGAAAAEASPRPRAPQQPGAGFAPYWMQLVRLPRLRARVGKLRWGVRQSLAAAAVGAAAASVAGVTGAAAAVGAAAVVASTMAAFSSDGGVSVLASAAVTVAAVVAAAAAAATAFSGSEAAILIAAAASAAAMAMAAATSSGEGATSPLPQQQKQQQQQQQQVAPPSAAAASALASLPTPLPAPLLLAATQARTDPAAAQPAGALSSGTPAAAPGLPAPPAARRWVLRFGTRPAAGQAGGGRAAQARGGGRAVAVSAPGAGSAAGGAVRPVGRGWMLWWPGSAPPAASGDSLTTSARPAAKTLKPTSPVPRWLSWPLPGAGGQARVGPPAASRTPAPSPAVAAALGSIASATAAPRSAAVATTAAASTSTPAEPRRRPVGWFPPLGAVERQPAAESRHMVAPGGGSGGAAAAAASLAQLRSQLLGSLRAGSGRAALPLPPAVLSDGLELCNVMVEPVRRAWGSGRAGAAAAAAGQHLLPLRPPAHAPAPPPPPSPLAPVPAAQLWRRRCRGPSEGALEPAAAAAAAAADAPPVDAAPAGIAGTAAAAAIAGPGAAAPGLIGPRAAAEAARAALDSAAAAAAAAAATAAAAALGVMPARDGCPELVGVAPFVAVRRMEEGLRRQVLQRGIWWRALLGGVVGALLRPVALVGMLGRLPGWGLMQVLRRGHSAHVHGGAAPAPAPSAAAAAADVHGRTGGDGSAERQPSQHEWGALVVVASCRDPLRVLRGRDMQALRARAADAACPVVPVLLTCAESPPGRRAAAARALAAACGVAPGEVVQLVLEAGLLHTPAAAIPRSNLAAVWRGTAECEGAQELRAAVAAAVAAAAQAERQELQQQQQLQQSPLASGAQW